MHSLLTIGPLSVMSLPQCQWCIYSYPSLSTFLQILFLAGLEHLDLWSCRSAAFDLLYRIGYACDFLVHTLACKSTCLWQWFFSSYIIVVAVNLKMLHTCDQLHFDLCTELVLFRGLFLPYSLLFFYFTTLLFLQPFAPVSVDHLDLIFALNWLWLRFYANQKATEDSLIVLSLFR